MYDAMKEPIGQLPSLKFRNFEGFDRDPFNVRELERLKKDVVGDFSDGAGRIGTISVVTLVLFYLC